ncbi:MAG: serine hydrolase [Bacteroidota bacterium]
MKNLLSLCLLVLTCWSCTNEPPLSNTTPDQIITGELGHRLDSLLSPYIDSLRIRTDNQAGIVVGITKSDELIYVKPFGYANIETREKVNLNTIFHIASVSKPFTAVAIAKLIQQGKLQLEDRLIDHLPEFKMQGLGYENITIQHILTHTSGIPRHLSSGEWEHPIIGPEAMDYNLQKAKEAELDFEPGSEYSYSNSAFDILGSLIERVTGMRFHEYMQSNVLQAAGMDHTFYVKPVDRLPAGWAVPYSFGVETSEWSPYPYTENYFPSSGVQTSILDMCRWGLLHLNQGNFEAFSLLDSTHFELFLQPRQATPWGDQIALSWYLQSYLDRPNMMHLGNDTGFEAFTCIYPEDDISITIMANRDFARVGRLVNAASEILFGVAAKSYEVSAKYPFSQAFREQGIESAKAKWEALASDTTDLYFSQITDIRTCGAVLEWNKDYSQAKPILEYYLTKEDQSTYAWRILGNCHLNLSDTTAAVQAYKQALKINPTYEKAKRALEQLGSSL